ncbi:reverse transcriptase domain-containing protein [Tanacetum coccineum]
MLITVTKEMVVVEMVMVETMDALSRHSNLVIPRNMMGKEFICEQSVDFQARGRVAAMAMAWNDFKALMVEEFCPNNKRAKTGTGFVATNPTRNGTAKCGKCYTSHPENRPCNVCFNCQKPGHYARDCRALVRQVAPVNAVRMSNNLRECYECGSPDHFRNTCPKLNRAPSQVGNQFALEGSRNNRSNGNQVRGRAFYVNVNAMEAVQC